jgi:PAS domain-containing protein
MMSDMPDIVLAALAEPVMVTDPQGTITWVNAAAARRFGWDKLVGVPLADRLARWSLRTPDRIPIGADEDPVALALAARRPVLDVRFIAELVPGRSGRRSCCATSACRTSTGSRSRAACAAARGSATRG